MPKPIRLNKKQSAIVDDDVYEQLSQHHWFLSKTGYALGFMRTNGKFRLVYMHRVILNAGPDQLVDHINGNPLDNQRHNLRIVTPQRNLQDRRVNNLSQTKLKGVGWHKRRQKYHARIQLQGMRYYLGFFDDPKTAAPSGPSRGSDAQEAWHRGDVIAPELFWRPSLRFAPAAGQSTSPLRQESERACEGTGILRTKPLD